MIDTPIFKFKQFALQIDENVFPVTTDSVLLGAWTNATQANKILDLGSGCGILSLMLAQKTGKDAQILALDIDDQSVQYCKENVGQSPWKEKIECKQMDVSVLISNDSMHNWKATFDLIVSNPPYFKDQLKSQENHLSRSKHQKDFDYALLAKITEYYLKEIGKACFVIPYKSEEELTFQMYSHSFQLNKIAKIKHTANSEFSLVLLEYSKMPNKLVQEEIILFTKNGMRTARFDELTKDYYL